MTFDFIRDTLGLTVLIGVVVAANLWSGLFGI